MALPNSKEQLIDLLGAGKKNIFEDQLLRSIKILVNFLTVEVDNVGVNQCDYYMS